MKLQRLLVLLSLNLLLFINNVSSFVPLYYHKCPLKCQTDLIDIGDSIIHQSSSERSYNIIKFYNNNKFSTRCYGKKKKQQSGGGGGTSYDKRSQKSSSSSSSSSSLTDKLDSDYIFSLLSVTKQSPSSERQILSNINLSFYPTAKIGVVGSNGSGKSTLLKIMAGLDTEFSGTSRPKPGARIGYLAQEPVLNGDTVGECIEDAVKESRDILEEYNDLAVKLGEGESVGLC